MPKVCIGLFGFIRNPITYTDFVKFKTLLPADATIDIFITSPNKINEYDDNIIDKDSSVFLDMKDTFADCNLYVDVYEYDPMIFIKKVNDLGLEHYTDFPTYRVLSQHYSISRLCNNIISHSEKNSLEYDIVILTRHDIIPIIPGVSALGDTLNDIDKNIMFIWRVNTKCRDVVAEDRFILTGITGVRALCNFYDYGNNVGYTNIYTTINPEVIMGRYLSTFSHLNLVGQDDIELPLSPSINVKYSEGARNYMLSLLEKYQRSALS